MHASVCRYQTASEVHGSDPRCNTAGLAVAAHPEAASIGVQITVLCAGMEGSPGVQCNSVAVLK